MWRTVFVLALMTSTDPVRIGIAAVIVARPRPMVNLLAYWLGGMAAGIAGGLTILMTLRDVLPKMIHHVTGTVAGFTHGPVQVALGVLALLIAARLGLRISALRPSPIPTPVSLIPVAVSPLPVPLSSPPTPRVTLMRATRDFLAQISGTLIRALHDGHPSVAFIAGLGSATPPAEYLVALAAIITSGAAAGAQIGAIITFTVVVLVVVEIPLISFLATPAKTQAFMLRLQNWLSAHRRVLCATSLAGGGMMLLATGINNL